MRWLGVDPGARAAWAVVEVHPARLVSWCCVDGAEYVEVARVLGEACVDYRPLGLAIEDQDAFARKGKRVSFKALKTLVRRAVYWECAWLGLPASSLEGVVYVPAADWQRKMLGPASSRADSRQRVAMAIERVRLEFCAAAVAPDAACAILVALYAAQRAALPVTRARATGRATGARL